ncbi:MAG TPA: carbonic anhydrase, partial [Mycobacteriales bacterium]|nr:carbonic anhydrase [Mycobacteriales bacterium]
TDIDALVAAISPAAAAAGADPGPDPVASAVRANVAHIVEQLRAAPVLNTALTAHRLTIQGAVYDLDSGRVAVL